MGLVTVEWSAGGRRRDQPAVTTHLQTQVPYDLSHFHKRGGLGMLLPVKQLKVTHRYFSKRSTALRTFKSLAGNCYLTSLRCKHVLAGRENHI